MPSPSRKPKPYIVCTICGTVRQRHTMTILRRNNSKKVYLCPKCHNGWIDGTVIV